MTERFSSFLNFYSLHAHLSTTADHIDRYAFTVRPPKAFITRLKSKIRQLESL